MRARLLKTLALALLLCGAAANAPAQEEILRVIAMPPPREGATVDENQGSIIDKEFLGHFQRLRDEALAAGARVIVLEITTPGGMVLVAEQMIDDLRELRDRHGVRTVAYVPHHATSAGAMIALACGEILMGPNAEIGNVIPLQFQDIYTLRLAEPKIKSKVVTAMRKLAKICSWPELVLEAMADENRDVVAVKDRASGRVEIMTEEDFTRLYGQDIPSGMVRKQIAPRGVAINLTTDDVSYLKLPMTVAASREALPRVLGLGDRPLASKELLKIPASRGTSLLPDFTGTGFWGMVLLILGVTCIIMELKTPGLGVFGVLGMVCFIGYFLVTSGDTSTVALTTACLILGFFMLLAEVVIIPGFGVAGVAGVVLILLSLFIAGVQLEGDRIIDKMVPNTPEEWERSRDWAIHLLGALVVGIGLAVFIAKNLQHVPFLSKTLLSPPILQTSAGPSAAAAPGPVATTGVVDLGIGAIGRTETDLRPAGRARFEEHGTVDVVSDGEWIERGTRVRVARVEGNRVVVRGHGELA